MRRSAAGFEIAQPLETVADEGQPLIEIPRFHPIAKRDIFVLRYMEKGALLREFRLKQLISGMVGL